MLNCQNAQAIKSQNTANIQ